MGRWSDSYFDQYMPGLGESEFKRLRDIDKHQYAAMLQQAGLGMEAHNSPRNESKTGELLNHKILLLEDI